MVMTYKYKSVGTTSFNVDLGTSAVRLGSIQGFSERAEHLAVGSSQVTIDNPDGTVGHSSDQILGLQLFTVDETACPAGNQRLYTGYIGTREYGDGPRPTNSVALTGAGNLIDATLYDLNAVVGFRIIPVTDTAANRPAETVSSRLTWILGSTYLTGLVADNGLVAASAVVMTKNDYRGQRPTNVINDCEIAADYFAFVYPDETQTVIASLFFDNANTSTAYTTTLRLTNVLADVDNVTTFAVDWDFKLKRSPDDVGSQVDLPWSGGSVHRTRAATAAIYGTRDLSAPNANIRTKTAATAVADKFLYVHHTEEDRFTGTVRLPKAYVNNLRAGHRLQIKFRNRPGYTGWTWVRCLMRAPGQRDETDDYYTVAVELEPQEPACSVTPTFIQQKYEARTSYHDPAYTEDHSYPAATTAGNLLLLATFSTVASSNYLVAAPTGWNWIVNNALTEGPTGSGSYCNLLWKVSNAETTVGVQFNFPSGSARVLLAEYKGLANPVPYAAVVANRQFPGVGSAAVPATTYPAGPTAIIAIGFMDDGVWTVAGFGQNMTLRSVIPNPLAGPGPMLGDVLQNAGSGTTPFYPAAGNLAFGNTGGAAATYCIGVAFSGDNC